MIETRHGWMKKLCLAAAMLSASALGQTMLVKPYVQPSDGAALGATDVKVIAWMTDATPGTFTVEFGRAGAPTQSARPERTALQISEQHYLLYAAKLTGLPPNSEIHYRVKLGGQLVGENDFSTRRTPDQPVRFVVAGDLASSAAPQRAIAYQMAQARPQLFLVCGDVVPSRGLLAEYEKKFWPIYLDVARADPAVGAPLMQSVPFYIALGNHDVLEVDLAKMPDAFAAFYFFHPSRNGPGAGPWVTPIVGAPEQVQRFTAAASPAGYPDLCFYSFDDGAAHFLVIDSDNYMPVLNAELREWMRRDLTSTKAKWKMVFCHHPGFNSSAKHGGDQRMRLFAPLWEECGVDVVFAGHVHNYQRSKPLRFTPSDPAPAKLGGLVRGKFAIDENFDGREHTAPDGVIYVVTGGGGVSLYTMLPNGLPGALVPDADAPTTFTAKFVDDRHSFSLIDVDARQLVLRQIDDHGAEVDRVTLTKTK